MKLYNIKGLIVKKTKLGLLFPVLNVAPALPLFLLIHITLSCNRGCSWCYQKQDGFYGAHGAVMSVKGFINILSSYPRLKPHLHLFGGEPLFHPEFPLFLKYCRAYNYRPTLTTNGDYLAKFSEAIMRSSLTQINISLNGIMDVQGNLNRALQQSIAAFLVGNKGRITVNLNYVLEPGGVRHIEKLVMFLNTIHPKSHFSRLVLQHFIRPFSAPVHKAHFEAAKISQLVMRLKRLKPKFELSFLPNIHEDDLAAYYTNETNGHFGNRCYVPWLGLAIFPDLSVTPGGGVLGCNTVIGNLGTHSIHEVWRGPQLKLFRLKLMQEGLPVSCCRCCHRFYH